MNGDAGSQRAPEPADSPAAVAPTAAAPTAAAPTPPADHAQPRGSHIWLVRSMLAVAALLSVIGVFAVSANRQLLDTSYWTATNTKLLESVPIQEELSSYLTDQLYANVDVAGEI